MGLELGRRDGRNVRKQEVAKSKGERREGVAAKTHINYEEGGSRAPLVRPCAPTFLIAAGVLPCQLSRSRHRRDA